MCVKQIMVVRTLVEIMIVEIMTGLKTNTVLSGYSQWQKFQTYFI